FQKGTFVQEAGSFYSMWYADSDSGTKRVKRLIGRCDQMSERAARRKHALRMEEVNRDRGSLAPAGRSQTFAWAVDKWRQAIAPNLSPATVRPRESQLRVHIMPRFGITPLHELGLHELQSFATDLRKIVSRKTIIHILTTIFAVVDYAARCGVKVNKVRYADLELGSRDGRTTVPFFTREQAVQIVAAAKEPFKTLFAIAWNTGLRAGEIMALTVDDLDFTHKTIRVNKSADDSTRIVRQPKTKCSVAALPMPSGLESVLRNYLMAHWKPNVNGILFPDKTGRRSRSRDNVVRCGLHPVLRQLGIPTRDGGLHAFRHGLATQLVEASVPLSVLQKQLRHADVATTLRIYAHAIPQSQRDAMENVTLQSVRNDESVLKFVAK
ncbi:MAG: site-specific integrase, partial [Candidatus Acidiferrales bacterium]